MFEIKNLTDEKTFIFILCYTYNLNLLHVFKLYELSNTLFKSFLKAFQPMLRLSNNKLIMLRMQADRVYDIVTNYSSNKKYRENDLLLAKLLNRHCSSIYACNDKFYRLSDLIHFGVSVLNPDNTLTPISFEELSSSYSDINNILVNDIILHRTTPISFLLSKYFGDKNSREILNMGLTDIHKMLEQCCE